MAVTIVISERATPVEHYAAEELRKYLSILYRIDATVQVRDVVRLDGVDIVMGDPRNHPSLIDAEWPSLSADGFCLKTVQDEPAVLVVYGGSGRGTLFGTYELLERWGVRFLLSGDVLPEEPEPFQLMSFDETSEPAFRVRALRPMANLPEGSAAWDLADFTSFIDQMAKLKFNTFVFVIMESGPWLDYEFRGMRRPAGDVFYGYRFPINDDFIGKELFPGKSEFYNPILATARDDDDRKELGIKLVQSIIQHCKSRDLMTILTFSLLEPPTAFKHKCNEWTSLPLPDPKMVSSASFSVTPAEEFGINPDYCAWMNVLDSSVQELIAHRLRTLINTYPDADYYHLWVSEHRASVVDCEELFRSLSDKYHLSPAFDWNAAIQEFSSSPFDRGRYQNQIKGDLLFLYALDKILNDGALLQKAVKPNAAIGIAGVMPQLAPILTRMLPAGSDVVQFLDYGSHGTAERIEQIVPLLKADIPTMLEIGIQDDNNMYCPQANAGSLERIVKSTAALGMKGFVAALWQVRQSDLDAAYLAHASWQPNLTASKFYEQFLPKIVGLKATDDVEHAHRIIETADRMIRKSALYGYAFVLNETVIRNFIHNGVDREEIDRVATLFQTALRRFISARARSSGPGLPHLEFWIKRAEFALAWFDLAIACANLGTVLRDENSPDGSPTTTQKREALAVFDDLLNRSRVLIELIASDARHLGDLGQIATLNHHVHRYLKKRRAEVENGSAA